MTTQPQFPVELYFQPPAKRADGRRADVVGHIPYHPEVARALRRSLPPNYHANVPMLALFLTMCARWSGKSTKKRGAGDLSFGKTMSQWEDELGISNNQIRVAFKLLCVDAQGKSKGRPNLGLVQCVTRKNGSGVENRFTFLTEQVEQWWLAFGPQPALPMLSTSDPQPLLEGGGSVAQPTEGSVAQPTKPYKHTNKQTDKPQTDDDDDARALREKIALALERAGIESPTREKLCEELLPYDAYAASFVDEESERITQRLVQGQNHNIKRPVGLLIARLREEFNLPVI